MSWISVAAIFMVVWWLVLFAMLPFGLKTQDDDGEVTLGTVSSAPRGPHMLKTFVRTTIVSIAICGVFFLLTRYFHLGVDDIPRIIPDYN
ncbi:MAG: DUF1467 family protein [Rhizobiaceae bacterium]|nr:DUF1467 family protein [Rhizobiaceae bacterium]